QQAEEWRSFCEQCADRHGIGLPLDLLGKSYCWADQLATHFAQNYRSGHVLNFLLAAGAVVMGLGGFLLPGSKLMLASIELALTTIIIVNTRLGVRAEWHRR